MTARLSGQEALDHLSKTGDVIFVPEVSTFDDEFNPALGPPRIKDYTGIEVLKARTPHYNIGIDAGAFRALWEATEHEARYRYPTKNALEGTAALLRALTAIREAYWSTHEPPPVSATKSVAPVKKQLVRRKDITKPDVERYLLRQEKEAINTKLNGVNPVVARKAVGATKKLVRRPRASS